eukprot:TRINITY_DN7772_c0_g2_i1.p1 TRINITY_DN7772_c0_g2~~TRINITY_DN7772_c0_g2_i1.p1  ORF type:complete len:749 (-),score=101.15 TRINITY_DN7772_c0_g2_i1:136-2382(-)
MTSKQNSSTIILIILISWVSITTQQNCPYNCNGQNCVNGECECNQNNWGKYCQWPLVPLEKGQVLNSQSVSAGSWILYSIPITTSVAELKITVQWSGGLMYPLVFVNKNTYPTVTNYVFADLDTNTASKTVRRAYPEQVQWVVGITPAKPKNSKRDLLANDNNLLANFSIVWNNDTDVCPNNCNSLGNCTSDGTCSCNPPFQPPDCSQGSGILYWNSPQEGQTASGMWVYYSTTTMLPLDNVNTMSINLTEIVLSDGIKRSAQQSTFPTLSYPLFVKRGSPPTLYSFDYYMSDLTKSPLSIYLPQGLGKEVWYIGLWGYASYAYSITVSVSLSCPNDCYGNGVCNKGRCSCKEYYNSPNCQTYERQIFSLPPEWATDSLQKKEWKNYFTYVWDNPDIYFTIVVPIFPASGNSTLMITLQINSSPTNTNYLKKSYCYLDQNSVCTAELHNLNSGDGIQVYMGLYYTTTSKSSAPIQFEIQAVSTHSCPNNCSAYLNSSNGCIQGKCECYEYWKEPDCSVFMRQLLSHSGQQTDTMTLSNQQWNYYSISNLPISTYLLNEVTISNGGKPLNLYFRHDDLPTSLSYDAKLSYDNVDSNNVTDYMEKLLLTGNLNLNYKQWYLGVQASPQFFQTSYWMKVFFDNKCSNPTCSCPTGKAGPQCLFPYKQIKPGKPTTNIINASSSTTSTTPYLMWNYYWVNISTPSTPVGILMEEYGSSDNNNNGASVLDLNGLLWIFVKQNSLPTFEDSNFA